MNWLDSHCHINDEQFSNDLDVVLDKLIENANSNGGKDNITVVLLGGMSENTLFPNEGPAEEN